MSFDDKIVVNIFAEAQAVSRRSFGTVLHITDDLGAGFTERVRFYTRNQDAQADTDLLTTAKAAAAVFFSQPAHGRTFAIGRIDYSGAPNTIAEELDFILAETNAWYGLCASSRLQANIEEIGAWAEANAVLYAPQDADAVILTGGGGTAFDTMFAAAYGRSAGLYYSDDTDYPDVAWLTGKLAVDPDVRTTTWSNLTLVGMPFDILNGTEKTNLRALNANAYLSMGGVGATGDGTLFSGAFIDTLISKDWVKARTTEAISQLLLDVSNLGSKIPYTDAGMAQIEAVIRGVFQRGVAAGHFRDGSIVIEVPPLSTIDPAVVASRALTIEASVILAGAIETVTLNIAVLAA